MVRSNLLGDVLLSHGSGGQAGGRHSNKQAAFESLNLRSMRELEMITLSE